MERKLKTLFIIGVLVFVSGLPARTRDLMPYFEQESWLAYAAFGGPFSEESKAKIIRIRDDNFRFASIDPSFAMRDMVAIWHLCSLITGSPPSCPGPGVPAPTVSSLDAKRVRILELLAGEAQAVLKHIPEHVRYRFPILVLGTRGEGVLKMPLPELSGELAVSRRATRRFNERLPLSARDVRENALPPYVLMAGQAECLAGREVIVDRLTAERIAEDIKPFLRPNINRFADWKLLRRQITSENLTDVLAAMVQAGTL